MKIEDIEDQIHEFGHNIAWQVQQRLKDKWPTDVMEGFDLFHDIARYADDELKNILNLIQSK
jgi:hypothetical protein